MSEARKTWLDYQNARNYKTTEDLYNIIARNERFYAGDQWKGLKSNKLIKLTLNFLEQLVDVKVASIMANQVTINRKPDEMDDEEKGKVAEAAKAFTEQDRRNWERVKMDNLNSDVLLDAAISGLGGTFWFWDEDIRTGNTFKTEGDFKGETVDSINVYVSNPNNVDIQSQDWIILTYRLTVEQVKEMARKNGLPEEQVETISSDPITTYEGYDKAQNEQDANKDTSNNLDLLLRLWKDKKTGTVWFSKSTEQMTIKEATDTELSLYPLAIMNWKKRKKFLYGVAEITYIISNQQHINKLESMRGLHATLMSIPKVGYDRNMVKGFSNLIGGILPVNVSATKRLSDALHYWQPTSITFDFDKSIESTINKTLNYKGINDNVVGIGRPDNATAIIAQQRAAGVPLENIRNRYWQYLEDVALIWLDFYRVKYDMTRKLKDEDGNEITFKGTDYKDTYLRTKIDIGTAAQWSEIASIDVLNNLLGANHINIVEYLERFPKNIIPDQDKLIENKKQELGIDIEGGETAETAPIEAETVTQEEFERLAQVLETLPPEQQEQILALPPEQQLLALRELEPRT